MEYSATWSLLCRTASSKVSCGYKNLIIIPVKKHEKGIKQMS